MRLTNINCPQCNGRLNQQEDKFYCTSCGSAFNIDYDEADVEYAKLVTEPERTRLLLDNNRILLEKNEELRRRFVTGERKKEFVNQVKSQGVTYISGLVYAAIIGGVSWLLCVIAVVVIFINSSKNYETEKAQREQARIERMENLSAKDIERDKSFLENAIAGGVAYEVARRDDPVSNDAEEGGDAYMIGSPVAVNCYLIKTENRNDLCIVYKITYEFSEDKSIKEVYDCIEYPEIEQDGTGHISFGHNCERAYGSGIDEDWDGYDSAEDVFDDNAFPDDSEFFKVGI